jgi:hypothetical protein
MGPLDELELPARIKALRFAADQLDEAKLFKWSIGRHFIAGKQMPRELQGLIESRSWQLRDLAAQLERTAANQKVQTDSNGEVQSPSNN